MFIARSTSEEFGSDVTRYRDNGEPTQGAAHGRDPRSPKEKEDKERGDEGISIQLPINGFAIFSPLISVNLLFFYFLIFYFLFFFTLQR